MQLVVHTFRPLEESEDLDQRISLDGTGHGVVKRILCLRRRSLASDFHDCLIIIGPFVKSVIPHQSHQIISQDMLQQKMEGMAMIMMTQMAQLMKKHIVLQDTRKTHYVQIEIDVSFSGTAAPIRCVMLDSHPVI